jgi:hypothetical protein
LKHRLVIMALVFASTLLTAESAVAARIHNLTPIPLKITLFWGNGHQRGKFAIGAGQRSDSLDYFDGGAFTVDDPSLDVTFCRFHQTKDLRGGNYLVIGHANGIIACTMCNSNRHQISRLTIKAPYTWQGSTQMNCG